MKEYTYVFIKPGFAANQKVVDYIKNQYKNAGLEITKEEVIQYDQAQAEKHYEEHKERPFFQELVDYMTSDYGYAMMIKGDNAISKVRELNGATKNPEVGTIRKEVCTKFGFEQDVTKNVVHASDSAESVKRETAIVKTLSQAKGKSL